MHFLRVSQVGAISTVHFLDIFAKSKNIIQNTLAFQATIGIDFLSKTMYLEDRTVRQLSLLKILILVLLFCVCWDM